MSVNATAKIFSNAISAMQSQQAIIATTGNNIANVNTPGYARRVVNLQTRVGADSTATVNVGNGVEISNIQRVVDEYLQRAVRLAGGDKAGYETESGLLKRAESLFSLSDGAVTIGNSLTQFFTAANDLSTNPASIELRRNFIERANDLTTAIGNTFNGLASLQTEADQRITNEIDSVNSLTAQIATLNGLVSSREATGQVAGDERDRRDTLLAELAQKISFEQVELADGTVTISLTNGFPLVSGTNSRNLETTISPSFNTGGMPPSLGGGTLSYIVYNYDTTGGTQHIDLSQIVGSGSGTLAGLMRVRGYNSVDSTSAFQADGSLVELASRVEAISRELLITVNRTYLGPDRDGDNSNGWDPSSGDLDGNTPPAYGLFTLDTSATVDVDSDNYPELTDLTDSSIAIDSFSRYLKVAITNPRSVAAARDQGAGDPAPPVFPEGDGSNMRALADMHNQTYSISLGSYTFQGTLGDVYNDAVGKISNLRSKADVNSSVAETNLDSATARRDEVSAVSLDEEFANLIKFQKAFEASARMIRTGTELLDQIVSLIG